MLQYRQANKTNTVKETNKAQLTRRAGYEANQASLSYVFVTILRYSTTLLSFKEYIFRYP